MIKAELRLPLKREYFEQISSGVKKEEYRLYTPYWQKRLQGNQFGLIVLTLGYPKLTDTSRVITRPWQGYTVKTIKHKHFGPNPVRVFAIKVN